MSYLDILAPMLARLKPPEKILPSEWAERELVLPRESNARAGRPKLSAAQRGMVDAAAEPDVHTLVFSTSAQIGKTFALHCIMGWSIATDGGPHLIVRPDDGDIAGYVRETLNPLIASTPALRSIVGVGGSYDNKNFKQFAGGSLALASAHKASALAGRSVRVALFDEITRYPAAVATGEGEPVKLGLRRLHSFRNTLAIIASTPGLKATCRVTQHFERGDKRLFHVPCGQCGALAPITPERLHHRPGDPSSARLKCLDCGHLATERERLDMLDGGQWVATAIGEPGVASFHLNELASPFSSLANVAAAVDAAVSFEDKKALQNLVWGLLYESDTELELVGSQLAERAEDIAEPFDRRIAFVTCGADVQQDRIEAMFVGFGENNERWILNHTVLFGDVSGQQVWQSLHSLLGTQFRLADGRILPLSATFIDAGFSTDAVAKFVAFERQKQRRVWAIFGRPGWERPACKDGNKVRGLMRGVIVGVDPLKLAALKSFALVTPGQNYVHLPIGMDANFYEQLTSERLTVTYDRRGFPRHSFEKLPHVRNEALDAFVYANAAATKVTRPAKPLNADAKPEPTIAERAARLNSLHNPEGNHHGFHA